MSDFKTFHQNPVIEIGKLSYANLAPMTNERILEQRILSNPQSIFDVISCQSLVCNRTEANTTQSETLSVSHQKKFNRKLGSTLFLLLIVSPSIRRLFEVLKRAKLASLADLIMKLFIGWNDSVFDYLPPQSQVQVN